MFFCHVTLLLSHQIPVPLTLDGLRDPSVTKAIWQKWRRHDFQGCVWKGHAASTSFSWNASSPDGPSWNPAAMPGEARAPWRGPMSVPRLTVPESQLSPAFQSSPPRRWTWLRSFQMSPAVQVTTSHSSSPLKLQTLWSRDKSPSLCPVWILDAQWSADPGNLIKWLLFYSINFRVIYYAATDD